MKIGIDGSRAFIEKRTGIEEYSYQVIKNLTTELKEQEVILYVRKNQQIDFELPKNFRVKVINFPKFWTQAGLSLEMFFHPVDTLFIPAHTVPFIHPSNTIVTIHGLEYEFCPEAYSFFERLYMRFVIKNSCKWAKKVICVSENTKKDVMKLYGVSREKIDVIYEGYVEKIELEALEIEREISVIKKCSGNLKGDTLIESLKPYIFFIGRIEKRKNIEGIIEAFNILKEKYGISHQLVLAGGPGFGYEDIKNKIENSKFKKDIIEKGYVSEKNKWELLKNADVFVFPSFYEGFGLPILEAQNVLTPVVTSNVSSIPEVADEAVLYADPNNTQEIAENIYILISNEKAREDIVKRGLENVKRFSWINCANKIARLLS